MGWITAPVSIALAATLPATPPNTAMQRHAGLKAYATQACFERLSRGAREVGSTIVQAGTNATDLCGCIGELFATSTISSPLDPAKLKVLATETDGPVAKVFDTLMTICIGRLRRG